MSTFDEKHLPKVLRILVSSDDVLRDRIRNNPAAYRVHTSHFVADQEEAKASTLSLKAQAMPLPTNECVAINSYTCRSPPQVTVASSTPPSVRAPLADTSNQQKFKLRVLNATHRTAPATTVPTKKRLGLTRYRPTSVEPTIPQSIISILPFSSRSTMVSHQTHGTLVYPVQERDRHQAGTC